MKLYFSVNHQEEDYQLIYVNGDVKKFDVVQIKKPTKCWKNCLL